MSMKRGVEEPAPRTTLRTPAIPGPFVNNRLLSLGVGRDGVERFWISTYNATGGALGILADELGRMRRYDLGPEHASAYAAAAQNASTLWLCGEMSQILKLDLNSGKLSAFPTGAGGGLCHAGMALDRDARQLLVTGRGTKNTGLGVSFDLRTHKATLLDDQWPSLYCYNTLAAGPSLWVMVMYFPGKLLRWNAATRSVAPSQVDLAEVPLNRLYQLLHDERWGWYLPGLGWYDAQRDALLDKGPRPAREMMWFGKAGDIALGAEAHEGQMLVHGWDMTSGEVREWMRVPDMQLLNIAMTRSGRVATMSIYGEFRVIDIADRGLRLSRPSPSLSRHGAMCLRRVDRHRILGTTFISQRFWMADLTTGKAWDCGRAAPGTGQITQTCRIGKRIYMAAYTGGELMEFDPDKPAAFPANPRVVASMPLAMRPVALLAQGPILWYACSRKYGLLGSVLFRYDTRSGEARWAVDPLGPRQILSLAYDPTGHALLCGSTIHGDQAMSKPSVSEGMLASLDADTLSLRQRREGPTLRVQVVGWLGRGRLLCQDMADDRIDAVVIDARTLKAVACPLPAVLSDSPSGAPWPIVATPVLGRFVLHRDRRLELHDLRRQASLVRVLARGVDSKRWSIDNDSLLMPQDARVKIVPCHWGERPR
jgi:hypothetical protein